jgi:nucleotidyltransferase/DNA polymerase involved in DNA repair
MTCEESPSEQNTLDEKMQDDRKLKDLAGVGPAAIADLHMLGIHSVAELAVQDGEELYDRLCRLTGTRHDICCLDVFRCVVAQASDPELLIEQRNWWYWSNVRKQRQAAAAKPARSTARSGKKS